MRNYGYWFALQLSLTIGILCVANSNELAGQSVSRSNEKKVNVPGWTSCVGCEKYREVLRRDKVSCYELTDGLCEVLWNPQNSGLLDLDGEKILPGDRKQDALFSASRVNLKALVDARDRLPGDLKKALGKSLSKLKKHLEAEERTRRWTMGLQQIEQEINTSRQRVAHDRTIKRRPDLKKKYSEDMTWSDTQEFRKDEYEVRDELLEAKYKEHPNWLRVVKLFEVVRKDLIEEIKSSNDDESQKTWKIDQISSVGLTLPYTNPAKLGDDGSCGSTEKNAYYVSWYHRLSICAGWFNAYSSEDSMYYTLAHEISHGIEVEARSQRHISKTSIGKTGLWLCHHEGPPDCSRWRQEVGSLVDPSDMQSISLPGLKLSQCLQGIPPIHWNEKKVEEKASELVDLVIDQFATRGIFSTGLISEYTNQYGDTKKNEQFLEKEKMFSGSNRSGAPCAWSAVVLPIYYNVLACELSVDKKMGDAEAAEKLSEAVARTKKLSSSYLKNYLKVCGTNCSELSRFRLSRPTFEQEADLYASRAHRRYVSRFKNLDDRRKKVALATAPFCIERGVAYSYPLARRAEKKESSEPHSEDSKRRHDFFTQELAQLVQCDLPDDVKERKECQW